MADLEQKQGEAEGQGKEMFSIERSEFDRLQLQLIELRTANYQLKEQHSKSTAELTSLQQTVQTQSRELEKANKTIQRSKKAKEFSALVEENDSIQRKLERQEDDFRLQNKTLMEELSKICEEKDSLESELQQAKRGGAVGGDSEDRVTHLKAENTALLKSVQTLKDQLKESVNGHSEADEDSPTSANAPASDKVLELELRLSTEEEEKKLLQEKLTQLQELSRKQQADLQADLEKWTEKAKKKQDSLMQLQEEKERHFHESRASFDEMVRSKDHEIQSLQATLQQTLRDLDAKNEASEATQNTAKQVESLKTSNEELNLRTTTLMTEKEVLVQEKGELQALLTELGSELQQTKADLGEQRKHTQELNIQLEKSRQSQEQLADQVVSASEERHRMTQELSAAGKLAEKRKALLDEMAIKEQTSATQQQNKVVEIEEQYKEEVSKLEDLLQQEQSRNWKLTEANEELPVLRVKCEESCEKVESLEGTVRELEENLSREKEENSSKLVDMEAQHQQLKEVLEAELNDSVSELQQSKERVEQLEMELDDKQQAVRIVEKKSQSLLKDLKRQLQQMQKKEERMHEQLVELRGAQMPEFQREISHDQLSTHSRDSSLSSVRGLLKSGAEQSDGAGGVPTLASQSSYPAITEETQELLARVAELQKDKWALEEKVNHLENTGSALAEDVIQKSEIIKTYFMETKADHAPQAKRPTMADKLSPMKLMPWARNKEETLEEINRKMQRALEEALMKNIHLQQNMEMLTAALEKATKESQSITSSGDSGAAVDMPVSSPTKTETEKDTGSPTVAS